MANGCQFTHSHKPSLDASARERPWGGMNHGAELTWYFYIVIRHKRSMAGGEGMQVEQVS